MTTSSLAQEVIVGVDTHKDVHVAVAIDVNGRRLGEHLVPTTERGCVELHRWALGLAPRVCYGVEGTGSYGAGLSRYLQAQGSPVTEIRGPNRKLRRDRGKSDTIDAEAAARAVLAGTSTISPKAGNDWVEQLRILRVARRSAVQARTQAINQMHAVVVGAPQELRDSLQQLPRHELILRAARFRVAGATDAQSTVRFTLRLLALRYKALSDEVAAIDQAIAPLLQKHAARLLALTGVGPEVAGALLVVAGDNPQRLRSEASFAALCGVTPLPASSGKTSRHRLNQGGDRQGNCALWRIAMTRMSCDQRTQAYACRRTAEGLSKREIIRCLKRYIARDVFRALPEASALDRT
jgi:transposase